MKIGFDNKKYIQMQSEKIKERISQFGGKLYLEFGGKLFDDYHASRVLPGFLPDSKINMLKELAEQAEIIIAINASDIQKSKVRGDLGILYKHEVLRLIDAFRENRLFVGSVVITQFTGQPDAQAFKNKLSDLGIKVYCHYPIPGYPNDVANIISDDGCGKNDYVETSKPLIIVTGPGPGSGKMAVCLSQLYHENLRGVQAGYAKFETFPIWNLPLKHPVNLAYEAATVDLNDVNMIDPFHLEAYGKTTINYNRDVEIFPVLISMFNEIYGKSPYNSPTDMGVNMAGYCIINDETIGKAACNEIIRRYFTTLCAKRNGLASDDEVLKMELIMRQLSISPEDRAVVISANEKEEADGEPAASLELPDGRIVTGKTTSLLGAPAALILNAIKELGGINADLHLISPVIIGPIQDLKVKHLGYVNPRLQTDEVLVALSICAATSPIVEHAMNQLKKLRGCEAHSTIILSQVDENVFRKLGINLTCEPKYQTNNLYHI
ncbi:MAG: DUF1846 domain-containing protein [Saccharofermentanales bacterium]